MKRRDGNGGEVGWEQVVGRRVVAEDRGKEEERLKYVINNRVFKEVGQI